MRKCPCLLHLWIERAWYALGYIAVTLAAFWGLVNLP